MDIAALSMQLSTFKVQNSVGIALTKKVMDQQQIEAEGLMKMMEQAAPPSEHIIDVKA